MDTAERLLREAREWIVCRKLGKEFVHPVCATCDFVKEVDAHLSSSESKESAAGLVHNDHPLRHFDRTCPACIQERKESAGQTNRPRPEQSEHGGSGAVTASVPAPSTSLSEVQHDEITKHLLEEAFDCDLCAQAADYLDLLRSLLAQREEEITSLQAEAFDWRMRAEAAGRRRPLEPLQQLGIDRERERK